MESRGTGVPSCMAYIQEVLAQHAAVLVGAGVGRQRGKGEPSCQNLLHAHRMRQLMIIEIKVESKSSRSVAEGLIECP